MSTSNEHNQTVQREVIGTHGFYSYYLHRRPSNQSQYQLYCFCIQKLSVRLSLFFGLEFLLDFQITKKKKKGKKSKIAFVSLGRRMYPNCLIFVSNAGVLLSSSVQSIRLNQLNSTVIRGWQGWVDILSPKLNYIMVKAGRILQVLTHTVIPFFKFTYLFVQGWILQLLPPAIIESRL